MMREITNFREKEREVLIYFGGIYHKKGCVYSCVRCLSMEWGVHIVYVTWCIKWLTSHNTKYLQVRRKQFKSGEGDKLFPLQKLLNKLRKKNHVDILKILDLRSKSKFLLRGDEPICSLLHFMQTLVVWEIYYLFSVP
jgi:hypothetical protein